jgi:hypothetical protein
VSLACEPSRTPAEVVFQWLAWYPKELAQAATLTTTTMRDGLSHTQWVEKNETLLKDLQFKYLEWKILEEDRDEVTASVTVQVRLYLVIREVRQVERYTLKNVDGSWRIDSQEIQEDHVIGRNT